MEDFKNIKKQEEIFKVPDNYFDEFQAKMSEVTAEKVTIQKLPNPLLRLAYTIPALMSIIVIGYFIFNTPEKDLDPLANISTADIIDFLEEDGISEDELISYLGESILEFDDLESNVLPESDLLKDIPVEELENLTEELEEYL